MSNIRYFLIIFVIIESCTNVQFFPDMRWSETPRNPIKRVPALELDSNVQVLYRFAQNGDLGPIRCLEIRVLFSGQILFYSGCRESQRITRTESDFQLNEFLLLVDKFHAMDFPETLPRGFTNVMWPSSGYSLTFRTDRSKESKHISVFLSADSKDYPEHFHEFMSEFYSLIGIKDFYAR